jgi:lipopolysaccharide export system protein LptC
MPPLRQILLALLLAAAGLLAWRLLPVQDAPQTASVPADERPDYTVERLSMTTMAQDGKPAKRLVARELRHYPAAEINLLEEPRLTLFKEAAPPWLIRSETGRISEDGDEVFLHGPVFADRRAGDGTRAVHVKTYELFIRADEQYARTQQPLHLTSGADWLSSTTGGELWFEEPLRLKLFGRARMQIDAPQPGQTRPQRR